MSTLSTQKTAHALRHFILCGILWAIYGPNATPASAIFSGFALSIGLQEAHVAFLVSVSALVGVGELFAVAVSRFLARHRALMVGLGLIEITAASLIVTVKLLLPQYRFGTIAALLVLAYAIGHTNNPPFSSWLSNVLPDEIRGRYIGKRMFVISITAMIYIFLASSWLDWQNKSYSAFVAVFAVGWIAGILGYLLLLVTPYPEVAQEEREPLWQSMKACWQNKPFGILTAYMISWTVASSMAGAFFGVYMINRLKLSYSVIAVFTNITLTMMMLGYLAAGNLAHRFGSKPLTQLLIIPAAFVPVLWAFCTTETYKWILPLACFVNGFCISGLGVSASNLLFKILPRGEGNAVYFAIWSAAMAAAAALGPFMGGILKDELPANIYWGRLAFSELQIIFLLAAALHLIAVVLSRRLVEGEATSPRYLLAQFRGNLLYMVFSYGLYAVARKDEARGEALRRLGQTRSPLAVQRLMRDLEHISPEVRRGAVKGLGEGRFPEAVEPLVQELQDKESDVRAEAAEALGKIGAAQEYLFAALKDHTEDVRVRQSAAMGLAELGTEEARQALLEALAGEFDRNLFPTLVEALARCEDLRAVPLALEGLKNLSAPVVRMHVINGICRILGEKNHFYRLATADEFSRGRMREKMMARIRRLLGRVRIGSSEQRASLRRLGELAEKALEEDRLQDFAEFCRQIAAIVQDLPHAPEISRQAALAIQLYLEQPRPSDTEQELIVFLIICLTSLSRHFFRNEP